MPALIGFIKLIKKTNKYTWIYECNFITYWPSTSFGHS